jgi:ribosome biogenesis GTPase
VSAGRPKQRASTDGAPAAGTVVEVHGVKATVLAHDGTARRVRCRPPRDRTTPAVGDRVTFVEGRHGAEIEAVAERTRSLWRPQERGRRLMASHVDRVVIVSAVEPELKPGLIDRFLVAADAADIEAILVVNKADLPGLAGALAAAAPYIALKYPVVTTSAASGLGLHALRGAVEHGMSVFVGHSGVGKSTLLNAIIPGLDLKTGLLSESSGKGRHTTSVTTCHQVGGPWPEAGALIVDTPGVRAFGLYGLELTDIAYGFRELRPFRVQCHFRDCLHEQEPDCAVRAAVEGGAVSRERYEGYLRLVESVRRGEG